METLAAFVLIAFSAPAAFAAEPWEKEIRAAFDEADVNGDGVINIDEYVGYIVELFAVLDKNDDSYLYPEDFSDVSPKDFALYDRDQDGRLSLGEAVAGKIIEAFEADINVDGVPTLEELIEAERKYRAENSIAS